MAALLCGKKKTVDTNGDILVDGMKCQSTEQRNAVLCSVDVDSVAVQYKDFIAMKKPERKKYLQINDPFERCAFENECIPKRRKNVVVIKEVLFAHIFIVHISSSLKRIACEESEPPCSLCALFIGLVE